MFGNLFKSAATIKAEILQEMKDDKEREDTRLQQVKDDAKVAVEERHEAEEIARKVAADDMKNSEEPWVEVRAIVHDPKLGIKVDMDWNDAFIVYLKQNGFTGVDDDQIIQKYIAILMKNMVDEHVEQEAFDQEEEDQEKGKDDV